MSGEQLQRFLRDVPVAQADAAWNDHLRGGTDPDPGEALDRNLRDALEELSGEELTPDEATLVSGGIDLPVERPSRERLDRLNALTDRDPTWTRGESGLTPDEAVDTAIANSRLSGWEPTPEFEALFRIVAPIPGGTEALIRYITSLHRD